MFPEAKSIIVEGLKRLGTKKCSRWAENYRVMEGQFAGPWTFNYHPWLQDMHDAASDLVIGMKAAQMGYTETALNKMFYTIDIKRTSVLYVLPASKPDAADFSTSRFDPALDLSPYLRNLFSDVRNIGHKRAGSANLFIRGSRSRSQLKSLPVSMIIFDEVAEMKQSAISLASERISGHMEHQILMISTPTIEKDNIHAYYLNSTQKHYFFKCPHCSRSVELIPEQSLVVLGEDANDPEVLNSHLICTECKHPLDHAAKIDYLRNKYQGGNGHWVQTQDAVLGDGYYINQLYSMTVKPYELAIQHHKARTDPAEEQELYNSKYGLPHATSGAKVTDAELRSCIGKHSMKSTTTANFITMGVDVGKVIHYEIAEWVFSNKFNTVDINLLARPIIIKIGIVEDFSQIAELINTFKPRATVIDIQPERRQVLDICTKYWGRVFGCFYGKKDTTRQINKHDESEHLITVNRTSWMDMALGRFHNGTISLPVDTPKEYREQIKAPTKILRKDNDGNTIAEYVTGREADHFAHARTYCEIALKVGLSMLKSSTISEPVL